jgi:hypothetical protein
MSGHHIRVVIEHDCTIYRWRCEEPLEASCHVYCNCMDTRPVESETLTGTCSRCLGPIETSHECNFVTWFEEGGTGEEQYGGEPLTLLDAEIEPVWNGDYYEWKVKT